jgi:hypothetical protein
MCGSQNETGRYPTRREGLLTGCRSRAAAPKRRSYCQNLSLGDEQFLIVDTAADHWLLSARR